MQPLFVTQTTKPLQSRRPRCRPEPPEIKCSTARRGATWRRACVAWSRLAAAGALCLCCELVAVSKCARVAPRRPKKQAGAGLNRQELVASCCRHAVKVRARHRRRRGLHLVVLCKHARRLGEALLLLRGSWSPSSSSSSGAAAAGAADVVCTQERRVAAARAAATEYRSVCVRACTFATPGESCKGRYVRAARGHGAGRPPPLQVKKEPPGPAQGSAQ